MTTVSVVTGAGGDMGRACALALAPTVDALVVTDLDDARLGATAELLGTTTKTCAVTGDISDPSFVADLVVRTRELGEFGALVHTAGLSPAMAEWRAILRVDLVAVVQLLDAFLPAVGNGSVAVCLASISGLMGTFDPAMDAVCDDPLAPDFNERFRALAGDAPDAGTTYRLAKRAVIRACERAAAAWGARGGRVVSLSPGLIDTGMGRLELEHNEIKKSMAALTPVGAERSGPDTILPGLTTDIADVVAFLCSERAAFISGCDIRVDGGLIAAMQHQLPKT
jgi:NAD(P)-dependent dehydrogenase (short-subunit alcohol dehydrogenase family)